MVFFSRTFPRSQKSAESGRQCGDGPAGGVSTLGSQRMAHARVVAHSSSWTPAAYEVAESSSSEEAQEEDRWVDEYGLTWIMTAAFPGRWRRQRRGDLVGRARLGSGGGGGEGGAGRRATSSRSSPRTRFCSVLWSRSSSTFAGPGQGSTARLVEQNHVAWVWCAVLQRDRPSHCFTWNLNIISTSPLL